MYNPAINENRDQQSNYDKLAVSNPLVAAVAASYPGPDLNNLCHRGIEVVVDVTAVGGLTPQVIVTIEAKDPKSGKYYPLLVSAALTAVGTTVLTVYPGVTVAANVAVSRPLAYTFRVRADVSGGVGAAITATISAAMML